MKSQILLRLPPIQLLIIRGLVPWALACRAGHCFLEVISLIVYELDILRLLIALLIDRVSFRLMQGVVPRMLAGTDVLGWYIVNPLACCLFETS